MTGEEEPARTPLAPVDRSLARLEAGFVVLVLAAMIGLSAVQLYLRKVHDFGFEWADVLIRQLVLWLAFGGGALATQQGRHIAIDAATRLLTPRRAALVRAVTSAAATVITVIMIRAAWTFLNDEIRDDTTLVGELRSWWFTAIIPVALLLVAIHFTIATVHHARTAFAPSGQPRDPAPGWLDPGVGAGIVAVVGAATAAVGGLGATAAAVAFLAALGLPLFAGIGALTMLGYASTETDLSNLIIEISGVASAPALVAIPLFTFAGYLMAESQTPHRLVALARSTVGWLPGGVAVVAVVACAIFTAFTGASGITIIALGGLLYPILTQEGFSERFSLGLLTSGGSLGLLFPPSLPVILYAIVAGVDVDRLFLAALVPGIVLVGCLGVYAAARSRGIPRVPFRFSAAAEALGRAKWELPLPIIVLWGIYGGWLTVNEAAIVTVLMVLVVQCAVYRDLSLVRDVPRIAEKSAVLVGAILLILGVALGLTNYLVLEEVPDLILEAIQRNVTTKIGFLISLNIFLLLVGCVLDVFSAIIVVVPLILPLAQAYGVHPLHLGVIFLTNLEIGYMTPPVGMNLFLSAFRFQKPLPTLYVASLPFIGVLLVALVLITYLPGLSLGLVGEGAGP